MPLFKGPNSVGKNIKLETTAGRPRKQAIAIALNEKRQSTGMAKNAAKSIAARNLK